MRWPSGTFDEGWVQLRGWLVTGFIALFMTTNISGSLTNRTVTDIMESHGRFAPLTDEAFMRLVMNDAYPLAKDAVLCWAGVYPGETIDTQDSVAPSSRAASGSRRSSGSAAHAQRFNLEWLGSDGRK